MISIDDLLFLFLKLMCLLAGLAVIMMVVNRIRGKDELNHPFSRKKKDDQK